MKKMIKISLLFISLSVLVSCDPPRFCNEPRCMYSDVYANIEPKLSGNLDSVIHIGDSIILELNIPDTLHTAYHGDIIVDYLLSNSFFGIIDGVSDSFSNDKLVGSELMNKQIIIGTSKGENGAGALKWDSKKYKCVFKPQKTGFGVIQLVVGRIELKDKDGKEWLVMPYHNFSDSINRHTTLFVSWWSPERQQEALDVTLKYKNYYYFEVR